MRYRYGFNGQEKDNSTGEGNLDFGARIYDGRIGRFLSVDRLTGKFPGFSPFLFAGNRPISAIDLKGDSLYILFYTRGNSRGDEMFEAAALTRQRDIESSSTFNPAKDKVVVLSVQNLSTIKTVVESTVSTYSGTYGKTQEFGIWSHSSLDGPVGTEKTTSDKLGTGKDEFQMSLEGWGKIKFNWANNGNGSVAGFYGCRSGKKEPYTIKEAEYTPDGTKVEPAVTGYSNSFVENVSAKSNFLNVNVIGQKTYSFPSKFTNFRENSENGANKFINWRLTFTNGQTTVTSTNFQLTYLVGGVKKSQDFLWNDQNKALPMRMAKNGATTNANFTQTGTKRP